VEQVFNSRPAGHYLYSLTQPAEKHLTLAPLSNVIFDTLTMGLIARWSWQLWGAPGALLSTGLAGFDPNLIAHIGIATTDLGATFFFVLTLYLLWSYLRQPRWLCLAFIGIALGSALGSKFSTITLLPTIGVIPAGPAAGANQPRRIKKRSYPGYWVGGRSLRLLGDVLGGRDVRRVDRQLHHRPQGVFDGLGKHAGSNS
jgi:hypothetical protein